MTELTITPTWIRVGACSKIMGMTGQGVLKRLKRIRSQVPGTLLRRTRGETGHWEVNVEVLRTYLNQEPGQYESEMKEMSDRIALAENRLTALRDRVRKNAETGDKRHRDGEKRHAETAGRLKVIDSRLAALNAFAESCKGLVEAFGAGQLQGN